ncbi:hypothetical protein HDC37_003057 [Microbacterium sp. AK009]|uniref:hypothetical protein n=1 Tax=Microbacterium sp. AK009 TaxID=2723068 RepID=UPI0015C7DED9|nr:hypothetical protein [Microbacterium sp. AK009]NYF18201.1 hypothetical protein [Microbacterium sp. AK009]
MPKTSEQLRSLLLSDDWQLVENALSALRDPQEWYERIVEEVRVKDDELSRRVAMYLGRELPSSADATEMLFAIQTPRKGELIELHIASGADGAQVELVSHDDHVRLSEMMIMFRFLNVVDYALEETPGAAQKRLIKTASKTLPRLLRLVSADPESRTAPARMVNLFDTTGVLRGFPVGVAGSALEEEMGRLFLLCQILIDRYYRFVRVSRVGKAPPVIRYSYSQEREARWYGWLLVRSMRRWFRAPASLFFVHAPLARLTSHYELRLEPIAGYYVREQFVLESADDLRRVQGAANSNVRRKASRRKTWWSARRGGWSSGHVFIGNGNRSRTRLYVAFRLLEVPPGATGRAWAGTALGSFILASVIVWSLMHGAEQSSIAPELLVALVALGSAALDNTTTQREVFNAPFLPRFILFNQTILAVITAIWLLTRGTIRSMISVPDWLGGVATSLTLLDVPLGIALAAFAIAQFVIMTWRSMTAASAYDKAMGGP